MIFYALLALIAGIGLASQAAINSRLSLGFGGQPLVSAFISFAVGTLLLLVLALLRGDWNAVQASLPQQSWWRWTGGAIGAFFVFSSVFLAPKIGIANTMFLFILGQLIGSTLIDHFGLIQMPIRPATWTKIIGLIIMLIGVAIFVFGSRFFGKTP